MGNTAADGSKLKHINVKQKTHELLNTMGNRGETMDDIVWRLVHELQDLRKGLEDEV